MTPTLEGLYVPLVTPFDEAGRVDLPYVERLAADCLDAGASGIVALATTGEATALDEHERADVVAACARVCGDRGAPLLVGAGKAVLHAEGRLPTPAVRMPLAPASPAATEAALRAQATLRL